MTGVFIGERRKIQTQRQRKTRRKEGHVTMEAWMGVIHLPVNESMDCWQPLDFRQRRGRILPYSFWKQSGLADTSISDWTPQL